MATTTNYAWETPDDTDLVKDGALAIRTLGSSIDTTTKALNPSTTLGDIEYRSATANTNTRLAIGSTGQVLTVSGGVPTWATPGGGGGGKVLQVIQATYSTSTSSSVPTYSDTGLSATITPSASTSKVLVLYSLAGSKSSGSANNGLDLRLLRGATAISGYEAIGIGYSGTAMQLNFNVAQQYLDNPSTTSATTYKLQFANDATASSVTVQHANTTSIMILMEIGA